MQKSNNNDIPGINFKDSKIAPDFLVQEKILTDEKENIKANPTQDIKNATTSSFVLKHFSNEKT
ncbi:MAG: hypothetical protein AABY22_17365 [Nanoarchaeota archaeon]